MVRTTAWALVAAAVELARAHTVITYPGWRGDNLITNGTSPEFNPNTVGVDYDNGSYAFPFGMQTVFPCGGLPQSTNRTKWPVKGGALAVQPGWGGGHKSAFIYINMGVTQNFTEAPANYSYSLLPPFAITGPNNSDYGGEFCLPQVPMPVNLTLSIGDLVTLQVVELTQNGAALYSCVDLELADPRDVETVSAYNCYNSTDIKFSMVFTSAALTSDGILRFSISSAFIWTLIIALGSAFFISL